MRLLYKYIKSITSFGPKIPYPRCQPGYIKSPPRPVAKVEDDGRSSVVRRTMDDAYGRWTKIVLYSVKIKFF